MRWNIHSFIEYYTFLNRDEGYVSLGKIPIFELITEQSNFRGAAFYVERKIEELRFSFSFPPRQLFERGDSFSNKLGSNDFVAFGNSVISFFFFFLRIFNESWAERPFPRDWFRLDWEMKLQQRQRERKISRIPVTISRFVSESEQRDISPRNIKILRSRWYVERVFLLSVR